MKETEQVITVQDKLTNFSKARNLSVETVKGDGHCLLYSVSANTGITVKELFNIIRTEFERDSQIYSIGTGDENTARKQIDQYLIDKKFNLPVVDNIPLIIAKGIG